MYYPSDSIFARLKRSLYTSSITHLLIIMMAAVLILRYIFLVTFHIDINTILGLTPSLVLRGHALWTLVTCIFVHADPIHLIMNMIALYYIGRYVERLIGEKYYILTFLLAGIGGSLLTVIMAYVLNFFGPVSFINEIHVGSSGAILGLFAVLAQDRPNLQIMFFLFIPPYLILPVIAQAKWVLIIQLLLDSILGFLDLPFDFIAHFGHVGGMLVGILLYRILLWRQIYTRHYGVVFISRRTSYYV